MTYALNKALRATQQPPCIPDKGVRFFQTFRTKSGRDIIPSAGWMESSAKRAARLVSIPMLAADGARRMLAEASHTVPCEVEWVHPKIRELADSRGHRGVLRAPWGTLFGIDASSSPDMAGRITINADGTVSL